MGQTASVIKEEARSQSDANEKLANDSLNSLLDLAAAKKELFDQRIRSDQADVKLIPIDKIITDKAVVYCKVSADAEGVKKVLDGLLGGLASGNFSAALSSAISVGLDSLFGNYSGSTSAATNYSICANPLGVLYRIDYYLYSYRFTSQGLIDLSKNVVLACLVVSSVNMKKITASDVRVVVASKFPTDTPEQIEQAKKIADEIVALLPSDKADLEPSAMDEAAEEAFAWEEARRQRILQEMQGETAPLELTV